MGKGSSGGGQDYGSFATALADMQASQMQYQLGTNQLLWTGQVYNQIYPQIQASANASLEGQNLANQSAKTQLDLFNQYAPEAAQTAQQSAEASLEGQRQANEFATQQEDFYNTQYKPLEQQYIQQTQNWATPEAQTAAAGRAQEMVADQFTQARSAAQQQLESYGVDPTSTRYAALDIGTRTGQAAAAAGAGTQAAHQRELEGMQLEAGAINTGRGYANAIPGTFGTAGQLGSAASGAMTGMYNAGAGGSASALNTAGGLGSASSGALTGIFGQGANAFNNANVWFNSGNSALGNAGNAFNNYYKNTYPQQDAQGSGIGAGLGLVGGLFKSFEDGGPASAPVQGAPVAPPQSALPAPQPPAQNGGTVPVQASLTGGKMTDDVPARLSPGEFVLPKDTVAWLGEKTIYGMVDKAKKERAELEQQTTTKPSALPALPGPPRFRSGQQALPR